MGRRRGWRLLELKSVTKMIVGMVLGAAVGSEAPAILEERLVRWIPEWRDSPKEAISLRHLVTHRTGLRAEVSKTVYEAADSVKLALESELVNEPGVQIVYNNSSVQLVAAIVERETGKKLDIFADEALFRPLGFQDWMWQKDDASTPLVMAGLNARGDDVARLGQLLLNGGVASGRKLLSQSWVEAMLEVGIFCFPRHESVKVFWSSDLIARWRKGGVSEELVKRAEQMADKKLTEDEFIGLLNEHLGEEWSRLRAEAQERGLAAIESERGSVIAFGHDGDLGQHLAVFPEKGLVAVRQRDHRTREMRNSSWSSFPADVWHSF